MTELSSTARSGRSTSGWLSGWPGRMDTARTSGGPLAPLPPHSASPPHRNPYTHTHTSPTGVRGEPHSTSPLAPHRHSYTHKPDTHTPTPCGRLRAQHTRAISLSIVLPPATREWKDVGWISLSIVLPPATREWKDVGWLRGLPASAGPSRPPTPCWPRWSSMRSGPAAA